MSEKKGIFKGLHCNLFCFFQKGKSLHLLYPRLDQTTNSWSDYCNGAGPCNCGACGANARLLLEDEDLHVLLPAEEHSANIFYC